MSRIGKKPIDIPEKTDVRIEEDLVLAKGPLGELSIQVPDILKVVVEDGKAAVQTTRKTAQTSAMWGLYRSLISNIIQGVSLGFEKRLEIQGVGYRARIESKELILSLGYSNPVVMEIPEGLTVEVEKQTLIIIKGIGKQQVGQFAANVRSKRKPEPYKGKGIRYVGEYVRRKVGKRAVSG